ncbi:MAG: hypothetical protein WCH05_09610, partial [Chlorobiaceae bacterium]
LIIFSTTKWSRFTGSRPLDCGTLDEYNLQFGHRIFSAKAERFGVAHRYEEFMDTHSDTSYRFRVSLPLLAQAISEC